MADDREDWERLRRLMLEAVRRRCPPRVNSRCEDIVQKAMLKVLERAEVEEKMQVGTGYWIRAAQNALVDELRLRRWQLEEPISIGEAEAWRTRTADPERRLRSAELGRFVHACLQGLLRPRKLAVTLHLRGHSAREAGELLGYRHRQVRNLVFRGMQDLKSCLATQGITACDPAISTRNP